MSGETMGGENLRSVDPQPVDPHLNTLTRTLFRSLHQASGKFAMFGHQNETSNVIGPNTDSDVHAVTGTYPALWGSDLSGVERDETTNIDGFSMGDVRDELLRAYTMGAVTTMSWHSANPITFGGYGHNMAPGSVAAVLPGGARHGQFLEWLDRVASFLDSVVDGVSGESVPIVFRPFHEHTGDWFWWCTGSPAQPTDTTPEQFVALWRMTVDYLRDSCGLHNVLYAYSPDRSRIDMSSESTCEAGYLYAYPGDDYVDVLGFDDYWDIAPADVEAERPRERHDDLITMLTVVGRLARERGKIAAATEVGSPGEFASRYVMSAEDEAALAGAALVPVPRMMVALPMANRMLSAPEQPRQLRRPNPIRRGRATCSPPRSPTAIRVGCCGTCRGATIRAPLEPAHTALRWRGRVMRLISAVSPSILSSVWTIPFRRCTDSRIPAAIRAG